MVPDFVIIGAPKAGTTWLARCLRQHPGIFLPHYEIHYWSSPGATDADDAGYQRHFKDAAPGQVVGERSNSYLATPTAPELMARSMPGTKLLTLLRNPVDRAYSGYCMRLQNHQVTRDIDRFLDLERSPCPDIVNISLYHDHLKRYLARFPRSQLHFLIFDDIEARPAEMLTDLCGFLGVAPLVEQILITEKVNPKETKRLPPHLVRFFRHNEWLRPLRQAVRKTPIGEFLRKSLRRETTYPPLSPELRSRLAAYYRPDVERLSELVGRDLTYWIAVEPLGGRTAESTDPACCV